MALPSLTLRNTKGSPLTFNEMDTNLQNLQGATINVTTGTGTGEGLTINLNSAVNFAGGPGIQILANGATDTITISNTGTVSAGTGLTQAGTTVSLNTATTSTIGGIKVGANLTITADGTLSATASGSGFTGTVAILTATQAVIINGITLSQSGGQLLANYTTSTTTSTGGVSTATLFQARLENNFTDDANTGTTAVNNGSVAWTTSSRFGTHSLDFGQDATQTTKNITFSNTKSMNFGTNAFTIEMWVYCQERNVQPPNYYHKIVQTNSTQKYIAFTNVDGTENFGYFFGDENNSRFHGTEGVAPVIYNQWNHLVFMRSGNNLIMAANGTVYTPITTSYTFTMDWTNIKIGGNQSVGFIDSVRVSSGTIYPTSGTYTVPTAEFPIGTTTSTVVTTSTALPYLPLAGGILTGDVTLDGVRETVYNWGNVSGTIAPNASSGTVHRMTLTGNITLNTLTNVATGTNMTIIAAQDATGSRTLTNTGWKWLGGNKTLSTTGTNIDVITVFYDGTNYLASLGKGYA